MLTEKDYRRALERQAFWEHLSPTVVRQRVEQLCSSPQSAELVQALSPVEFTILLKESPETRALLLSQAHPEQIRLVLDLDCWHKDTLLSTRVIEWLETLQHSDTGTFMEALDVLDSELLILTFRRHIRVQAVLPHEEEVEPLAYDEVLTNELYRAAFLEEESPWNERVYRLLDFLRKTDLDRYHQLMQEVMWGIDSELEEEAYRWKSGRLLDEGFLEYYEALENFYMFEDEAVRTLEPEALFSPAPPASAEETGIIPSYIWGLAPSDSLLAKALAEDFPAVVLERLCWEMAALCNRAFVMDQVDFANADAVRNSLQRVHAYLNLGLESLGGRNVPQGVAVLTTHSLRAVCQIGIRQCLRLRQRAMHLQTRLHKAPGMRRDVPGLAHQVLQGLVRFHPEFFEGLASSTGFGYRIFRQQRDLQLVESLLWRLENDPAYTCISA